MPSRRNLTDSPMSPNYTALPYNSASPDFSAPSPDLQPSPLPSVSYPPVPGARGPQHSSSYSSLRGERGTGSIRNVSGQTFPLGPALPPRSESRGRVSTPVLAGGEFTSPRAAPSPIPRDMSSPGLSPRETSPLNPNHRDMSPGSPYTSLGGRGLPESALLTPEVAGQEQFFRRGSDLPAPSLMSRDSTHESLSGRNTPGVPSNRNSWGSGVALAAAASGFAGEDGRRPGYTRETSSLARGYQSDHRLSTSSEPGYVTGAPDFNEKAPRWAAFSNNVAKAPASKKQRKWLWGGIIGGTIFIIAAAVGVGVGLTHMGSHSANQTSSSGTTTSGGSGGSPTTTGTMTPSAVPTSGGMGSLITLDDGSTMTYQNPWGGTWFFDPTDPFKNDAQCNSWTPSLNQNWTWGVDKIHGVNIGGWLNTEPFIVPSLYEIYANGPNNVTAVDEYTLSENIGANLTAVMTEHYDTFITEQDFADIASAGLNFVRIPLPHWSMSTWEGETYLESVAWTYLVKAIGWCRKYGIRMNIDLHTAPGSQNGWNHSGKLGSINWMQGVMGQANAQRMLDYVRTLAQFISQPEYAPVVQIFGFINEPNAGSVGKSQVGSFYLEAYNEIRAITGMGEGNGPILSIHDGFLGSAAWYGAFPGADRLALDQHPYLVFGDQPLGLLSDIAQMPCKEWSATTNTTAQQFGIITGGEWSAAPNDCGLWVNAVGAGSRYDGSYAGYEGKAMGSCDYWNDYTQWNQSTKNDLQELVKATQDSLQDWFFWTWKIGNSTTQAQPQVNPFWHYKLGLDNGWIPQDPRSYEGTCASMGTTIEAFDGTYPSAWMTGGAGAGQIPSTASASYPWPAPSFTDIAAVSMDLLPQYTQTGVPISLPGPTYTSPGSTATIDAGNGWFNPNVDTRQAYAAVTGCAYPSEYVGPNAAVTAGMCGAGLDQPNKREIAGPKKTGVA